MRHLDAYHVLGVGPTAEPAEIRAAFRRLVQQRHPDTAEQAPDEPAGGTGVPVQEVIEAYQMLSDPERRARYDADRSRRRPFDGGQRIPVRRVNDGTDPPRRGPSPTVRACPGCGGAGRVRYLIRCAGCGGEGRITAIGIGAIQVIRCRACGGQGRQAAIDRCGQCRGSGAIRI